MKITLFDEVLVSLGPILSRFFVCHMRKKQKRVLALVVSHQPLAVVSRGNDVLLVKETFGNNVLVNIILFLLIFFGECGFFFEWDG
jgi:hypothetical protein